MMTTARGGDASSASPQDWALLLLRLGAGSFMIFGHGLPKLLQFEQKLGTFSDPLGIGSAASLTLATGAEFFGSLLVLVGLFTRPAAVAVVITMLVAGLVQDAGAPFAKQELALAYAVIFASLAVAGAGRLSLGALLRRRVGGRGRLWPALVAVVLAAVALPSTASAGPEQEVRAAQDLWRQAMTRKDRAAFEKVLHPDLSYGHSSGLIETKAQAIQHVLGSTAVWERIDFTDTKLRLQGNTAFVTGKLDIHQRGKQNRSLIKLVVLTVWVKGAAGWQMIARQATRPEPPTTTPLSAPK